MQNNMQYTKLKNYRYFFFSGLILLSFFFLNIKATNATPQIQTFCYIDGCVALLDNPGGYWVTQAEADGFSSGQQVLATIALAASEHAGVTTTSLNGNLTYVACSNGVAVGFTAHGCGAGTLNDECPSGCGANTLNDTCPPPTPSGCGAGTLNDTCPPPAVAKPSGCGSGTLNDTCPPPAAAAPTCSSREGRRCYSSRNSCGMRSSGTYDCDGYCDAETPDDSECAPPAPPCVPDGSCTAPAPACEATTYGSDNCGGSCSKTGGSCCVSNQGATCYSSTNSCGMSNSGTIQCNGSCNASTPSNSECPATASLSANPSTIIVGNSSKLTWSSSYATSCTSAGGFSTGGATSNSTGVSVSPANTSVYQITCTGPGGSGSSNATVTVKHPTINTFSVSPARVQSGGTVTVSWSSTDVNSCSVTKNNNSAWTGVSSSGKTDTVNTRTVYTITCDALAPQTITVNVAPGFQEF